MCGIRVSLSAESRSIPPDIHNYLCNRGPDHIGKVERRVSNATSSDPKILTFTSTVLALRGDHIATQPLASESIGSVLCWNGEAWRIGGQQIQGNDAEAIFDILTEASASSNRLDAMLQVFRSIEGPFAFAYFDKPSGTLFFGRDRLGRRSLMIGGDRSTSDLTICSIAEARDPSWREVEADGIYATNLSQTPSSSSSSLQFAKHSWLVGSDTDLVSRPVGVLCCWPSKMGFSRAHSLRFLVLEASTCLCHLTSLL